MQPRGLALAATITALVALTPALTAAQPTLGTWLASRKIDGLLPVPASWGPGKHQGWAALPTNLIHIESNGVDYPVCLSNPFNSDHAAIGWIGLGVRNSATGKDRLACNFYRSLPADLYGGHVFELAANRPAPVWIASNSTTPEPWGAVVLATQQTSNRRVFACSFTHDGARGVGYIGDDGKCYGATVRGNAVTTSYQVLTKSAAAGDVAPRYGWVDGGPGYVPHGTLASQTQPDLLVGDTVYKRVDPERRTVCRVRDRNVWWPGYLDGASCRYFTYYDNSTQRAASTSYQVFRLGPGATITNYRFGNYAGKSFYSCVAHKSDAPGQTVWGFSSNTTACTDGVHTSSTHVRTLNLPNVDADRG